MCKQNHGVAVDYYALGVIAYECMLGQVHFKVCRDIDVLNRGLILEEIERRLETKFWLNKSRLRGVRSLKDGLLKLQILLIR